MTKYVSYTLTEKFLLDKISYMDEISDYELENLAKELERNGSLYIAIELGRCPSTDVRTYILHYDYTKPRFDYYGYEYVEHPLKTNAKFKVKLKEWKDLVNEFGLTDDGNGIDCLIGFTETLERILPNDRIVSVYKNDEIPEYIHYTFVIEDEKGEIIEINISEDVIESIVD